MASKSDTPLRMEARDREGVTVVAISGSAGMAEADKLRAMMESLAAKGVTPVVLDLGGMDFICSAGLGAIISGHLKSRHFQGQIRLVNPQPAVRDLLQTTRLTKLFPVYDTVEEAVAH